MTSYSCKCGGWKKSGKTVPPACEFCPYCETTLVPKGSVPAKPASHTWVTQDNGSLICSVCGWSKNQLSNLQRFI